MTTLDNFPASLPDQAGADLPLLLIFAGVIGGMLGFGLIGLSSVRSSLAVTTPCFGAWIADALGAEDGLRIQTGLAGSDGTSPRPAPADRVPRRSPSVSASTSSKITSSRVAGRRTSGFARRRSSAGWPRFRNLSKMRTVPPGLTTRRSRQGRHSGSVRRPESGAARRDRSSPWRTAGAAHLLDGNKIQSRAADGHR